jgi:hypothetical protein
MVHGSIRKVALLLVGRQSPLDELAAYGGCRPGAVMAITSRPYSGDQGFGTPAAQKIVLSQNASHILPEKSRKISSHCNILNEKPVPRVSSLSAVVE